MASNDSKPNTMGFNMTLLEMKEFILSVTKDAVAKKQQMDCKRNGNFMSSLSSSQLEGIFWGLFAFVIMLLIAAAISYARSENIKKFDRCHPNEEDDLRKRHRKQRLMTVLITTVFFLIAASCVAIEGIAGTALNYCHQHQLINFYWAMWGIIQIGSLIAIFGVTLQQWASLAEQETPPWNVALGTPILVIAAGAFIVCSWIRKQWKELTGAPEETEAEQPKPPAGIILGVADDGAIMVQFYSEEWRHIAGFRLTFEDKHGGATGELPICYSMKPHSHVSGMSQRTTLQRTDSNGLISPSAENSSSDPAHQV